jgi:hypothetical protein
MHEQRFPKDWEERRVPDLLAELDARSEEGWIAASSVAAAEGDDQSVVTVPMALVPEIGRLLAKHRSA